MVQQIKKYEVIKSDDIYGYIFKTTAFLLILYSYLTQKFTSFRWSQKCRDSSCNPSKVHKKVKVDPIGIKIGLKGV